MQRSSITKFATSLCFLILTILLTCPCLAQPQNFKITADAYQYENGVLTQWSNDMLRSEITTKDRGLIFKITISNTNNIPITIEDSSISVKVRELGKDVNKYFKQIDIDYIYLPIGEDYEQYIPVDFGYGDAIASYSAEIQFIQGLYVPQNVEPYPFEFRVLSEDQFQKELEQKRPGLIVIGDVDITIEVFGGISIAIIGAIILNRKRKKRS